MVYSVKVPSAAYTRIIIFVKKISPSPPWNCKWISEVGRSLVSSILTRRSVGRIWTGSVVGVVTGVAIVTGCVVGAETANGVRAGVATGIAVSGQELEVQPEKSTQSRITRPGIRHLTRFMSRGLLRIPISDLRLHGYAGSILTMGSGHTNERDCVPDLKRNRSKNESESPGHLPGHGRILCMRDPFGEPAFVHHHIRVPEIPFQDYKN